MMIKPRPYQEKAHEATFAYFENGGEGNPLIVAPTGSGKSIQIAMFMQDVLSRWPNERILLLAHRKELLEQNCAKLLSIWPDAPVGVYSAGLKSRRMDQKITIAGIQSIFRKAGRLGWISLVLVDECHLVPPDGEGMYQKLLKGLREINPNVRIVGYTATAFRMRTGHLIDDDGFFTDIAYEIEISDLITDGYLSPLISKIPKTQADLSSVHIRGGEYIAQEAEAVMDEKVLTEKALNEIESMAGDRKSWLVFCAGIKHANNIATELKKRGHTAESVTSETDSLFRAQHIEAFKRGKLQCLVGADIFTTGFDAPNIDLLVLLRPTQSAGLYIQMVGRGSRLSPDTGKQNCLVLDFAGNIDRHGPIDQIRIKRRATREGRGELEICAAPVKACPECRFAVPIAVMCCPCCGYVFPAPAKHDIRATEKPILSSLEPPQRYRVEGVDYRRHEKIGKPPSMRVVYFCEAEGNDAPLLASRMSVSEWVCLEHMGYAFKKACEWWKSHHRDHTKPVNIKVPANITEALSRTAELRVPSHIYVKRDGQFMRVVSAVYGQKAEPKAVVRYDADNYEDVAF